jgi:CheY-like chemotaxis protein
MPILPARPKILFVEGHATLRDVYTQLLALTTDFELHVAGNGPAGVAEAEQWQPDLILMGLRLPLLDGFAAIETLRQRPATAHIPIVVLSAWNSATSKQRAFSAGANAHLTPPIDTPLLVKKIRQFLH